MNILVVGCASSLTFVISSPYPSSHTRLRQLADFPSLILRSSFAEGSLGRIMNRQIEKNNH